MAEVRALLPPPANLVPPCPDGSPPFLAEQWEQRHLEAAPMILGPLDDAEREQWQGWASRIAARGSGVSAEQLAGLRALLATARLTRAAAAATGVPRAGNPARPALEGVHHHVVEVFNRQLAALGLDAEGP